MLLTDPEDKILLSNMHIQPHPAVLSDMSRFVALIATLCWLFFPPFLLFWLIEGFLPWLGVGFDGSISNLFAIVQYCFATTFQHFA
jgi:hypothetical protein